MKNFADLSPDELKKLSKSSLVLIICSLQEQLANISKQLNFLTEQIALMNQRSFGRKTEKLQIPHQMSLFEVSDSITSSENIKGSEEPEVTEVVVSSYTRKEKTSREEKLEGLPARIIDHKLSPEELAEKFPNGYKELPCEIYKRLAFIPQMFMVDEHHVHVYASKNNDGTIVRANRPKDVFRNSPATTSLIAALATGKYADHLPIERQIKRYAQNGVKLESNTLSKWMINASDQYYSILMDELQKNLLKSPVIHADETPFEVINDGRKAGTNSYMWVYRSSDCSSAYPVIIYDYQPTRRSDHPEEFLKDYSGILVTDGYQVYHSLEKKRKGLQIAGCWVHAKRKFSELVKAAGTEEAEGVIAAEATRRISSLFHLDKKWRDFSKEDRENQRQLVLKPKVDDFFEWAKSVLPKLPSEGATAKGLQYCINQEEFLRVFLTNGDVPMDNNLAEQAIRPFTLGRKNWVTMFSEGGAEASSVLYSLVETAKANQLKVFDYLEYTLAQLVQHSDDTSRDFLQDLLPWSKNIQERFRISKKS